MNIFNIKILNPSTVGTQPRINISNSFSGLEVEAESDTENDPPNEKSP